MSTKLRHLWGSSQSCGYTKQRRFARAYCETTVPELIKDLDDVMSRLMDIGSAIATPRATSPANLVGKHAL